jgi:hypothetical protein
MEPALHGYTAVEVGCDPADRGQTQVSALIPILGGEEGLVQGYRKPVFSFFLGMVSLSPASSSLTGRNIKENKGLPLYLPS